MKFLIFLQEEPTWNCFSGLYQEMIARNIDFDVIALPNWNNKINLDEKLVPVNAAKKCLKNLNIPFVDLESIEKSERINFIKNKKPDCIIVANKNDVYFKYVFDINIEQFTKIFKVFYIPYYGGTIVEDAKFHLEAPGFKHYWKFLADTQILYEYYISEKIAKENIINLGHPKIEEIYKIRNTPGKWPIANSKNKLKIIWAPHWSCVEYIGSKTTTGLINELKFGLFLKENWNFYNYAKNNPNIQILLRPHPLLNFWLKLNNVYYEYKNFIETWLTLPNVGIELDGLYNDSFAASDIMITDGASFLIEYPIATNKPIIFMDSGEHKEFNDLGKMAEKIWNIAKNFKEVRNYIENPNNLKIGNYTELLDKILPHRENTSKMILNELISHIERENKCAE